MRFAQTFAGLTCFSCGAPHDAEVLQTVCTRCGLPLRVDYRFSPGTMTLASVRSRPPSLWRYAEVLPIPPTDAVTLTEGFTPMVEVDGVLVKDESRNPTASFKARGMTLAVSLARALGARALAAPSAGNAAGALAAYGAAAHLRVTVAMPEDTPKPFVEECRHYGAEVHLVPGSIADAGKWLKANGPRDTFDVSTLKEPYRVEGKKTMAYELFEQLGELPDVIVYPTGGGTGLVGMWKAFGEMRELGWTTKRPRLVSVQAEGCAPVVAAFEAGEQTTRPWPDPHTSAYGLRVPSPIGGFLCLRALRETSGAAVAVAESDIAPAAADLSRRSGIDVCPEGGAAWAALRQLRATGFIKPADQVVLFNTGSGLKYR
ncbi:MAG TPA: threonine synthase [Myxococcales bacterium]|jgi:threonine synthase|nr:threonine synthase [Myxococcales bacterium]